MAGMSNKITREGDLLGGRIEEAVMTGVAQLEWSMFSGVSGHYEVEDPAETEAPEDEWPVILVRESDGQRFSVEVMVTVNPLPALIDEQQCSPDELAKRWARRLAAPLEFRNERCGRCSLPLVTGWIDRDGTHSDCEHLARMRASRPEWFADTVNQAALPIPLPNGGAL